MDRMESFLKRNFKVVHKNPSEDVQTQWRRAIGAVVKNCRRRFRMVPDLDKRSVVEAKKLKIQFAHQKYVQKWCNKKGGTTCEICL
ncbi:hypothetical protein ZIOFF_066598 [Zingiber officinale]|uniref:Calcium-transporting P-type ATPase N-terminal autoinhibitory domain-containing protein n=1 Tax=Zingiber officinale TaxID=94328 RepID=A0A8J5K9B7_ZINOF|nr:hypothetical protein ZIOFF_066598 [Zingiber officinale]